MDLETFIRKNVEVKTAVTGEDGNENGKRSILNLGHTIGHALESYFLETENALLHGEAVMLGMMAELKIYEMRGIQPPSLRERIVRVAESVGLPTNIPTSLDVGKLWSIAQKDKKNSHERVQITLLENIGKISQQENWTMAISREEFLEGLNVIT